MNASPSRRAGLAASVAAAILLLAGCVCSPPESVPGDSVIVIGATSGSSALSPAALAEPLSELDLEGDRLIAVVGDGVPQVVFDVTVPELPGNSGDRKTWLERFRADVRTALLAVRADSPEVDLTEAIALGAQAFAPDRTHSLYVYSSGLQTTGLLSMLDGRLYAEPADLVAYVEQNAGVPDLSGVRVRMPVGVVTDPQPALTEGARIALRDVWGSFFAASGAEDVDLTAQDLTARTIEDALPFVSPVPVERPQPAVASGCRQELGSTSIGFAAGSAELSDPTGVDALVGRLVDDLSGCEGDYVVEASASAEGGDADNLELSESRAARIAEVLQSHLAAQGAPTVRVVGWGEAWPCRATDLDAEGHLILDAAIANRVVVISRGEPGC